MEFPEFPQCAQVFLVRKPRGARYPVCGIHHHHLVVVTSHSDGQQFGENYAGLSWKMGKFSPGAILPQNIFASFIGLLSENIKIKLKNLLGSLSLYNSRRGYLNDQYRMKNAIWKITGIYKILLNAKYLQMWLLNVMYTVPKASGGVLKGKYF